MNQRPRTIRQPTSTLVTLVTLVALQAAAAAQRPPSLSDVVGRLMTYIAGYGPRLESIVAEEAYTQWTEMTDARANGPGSADGPRRVIRSDYALVRLGEGEHWVAFRDAFEVDGRPVRDREDRLSALLAAGGDNALRQAAALANESARFNIATNLVTRNVNVPTLVVTLLHPMNRERFRFSRSREMQADGRALWEVEFRERERPTLVRQQNGRDQPVRGAIAVDPQTGEIWETRLTWERGPGGHITVTFGRVDGIDAIVPVRMVEHYRTGPTIIFGEATYSNFRQFRTAARVVTP
jgi:hypothetical protein